MGWVAVEGQSMQRGLTPLSERPGQRRLGRVLLESQTQLQVHQLLTQEAVAVGQACFIYLRGVGIPEQQEQVAVAWEERLYTVRGQPVQQEPQIAAAAAAAAEVTGLLSVAVA